MKRKKIKSLRITGKGVVPVIQTSRQFRVNWRDAGKGLIMAVGTPVLYMTQELIPGWDISPMAKAAISAAVVYLLKNFFTPGKTSVATKLVEDETN